MNAVRTALQAIRRQGVSEREEENPQPAQLDAGCSQEPQQAGRAGQQGTCKKRGRGQQRPLPSLQQLMEANSFASVADMLASEQFLQQLQQTPGWLTRDTAADDALKLMNSAGVQPGMRPAPLLLQAMPSCLGMAYRAGKAHKAVQVPKLHNVGQLTVIQEQRGYLELLLLAAEKLVAADIVRYLGGPDSESSRRWVQQFSKLQADIRAYKATADISIRVTQEFAAWLANRGVDRLTNVGLLRDFEQLWRTNTADLLGPSQAAEQTLKKLRQLEYGVLERVLGSNVYAQYVSQHLQLHVSKQPRTQQASRVDKAAWASIQRSALAASQLLGSSSSSQSAAATPLLDGPVAYEPPTYHVKCSRCQTVLPRSCLALHRCGQKQLIPRCMMQELASQCGVAWAAGEPCFLCECSTEEGALKLQLSQVGQEAASVQSGASTVGSHMCSCSIWDTTILDRTGLDAAASCNSLCQLYQQSRVQGVLRRFPCYLVRGLFLLPPQYIQRPPSVPQQTLVTQLQLDDSWPVYESQLLIKASSVVPQQHGAYFFRQPSHQDPEPGGGWGSQASFMQQIQVEGAWVRPILSTDMLGYYLGRSLAVPGPQEPFDAVFAAEVPGVRVEDPAAIGSSLKLLNQGHDWCCNVVTGDVDSPHGRRLFMRTRVNRLLSSRLRERLAADRQPAPQQLGSVCWLRAADGGEFVAAQRLAEACWDYNLVTDDPADPLRALKCLCPACSLREHGPRPMAHLISSECDCCKPAHR